MVGMVTQAQVCAVLAIDHELCEIMKIAIADCKPYCGEDLVVCTR